MLQEIIIFAVVMSFVALRSPFYLKMLVGFAWFGVMVYWTTNPVETVAQGSPTDQIIFLVFMALGIAYLLWGVGSRIARRDVEVETSPTGDVIRHVAKFTEKEPPKESTTLTDSDNAEYRKTVRKALSKGNKRRR